MTRGLSRIVWRWQRRNRERRTLRDAWSLKRRGWLRAKPTVPVLLARNVAFRNQPQRKRDWRGRLRWTKSQPRI